MPRIVVAGASGRLGAAVCTALEVVPGAVVVAGDHRQERAAATARRVGAAEHVHLDVDDPSSVEAALNGADAVVLTVPERTGHIRWAGLRQGVHVLDVAPDARTAREVRTLDDPARGAGLASVAMAGMFPGLSGLAAVHLGSRLAAGPAEQPLTLHVELILRQSSNAQVGPAGVTDLLRLVAAPVRLGERHVAGLTVPHPREDGVRLIGYEEAELLERHLPGADVRYWTGWDSHAQTLALAALSRLGLLHPLAPHLGRLARHDPSRPERAVLVVRALAVPERGNARGAGLRFDSRSDYGATSALAAALTALAVSGELVGAGVPADLTTLEAVLPHVPKDAVQLGTA